MVRMLVSCWRAAIGIMVRMAVHGLGICITIGGPFFRLSVADLSLKTCGGNKYGYRNNDVVYLRIFPIQQVDFTHGR